MGAKSFALIGIAFAALAATVTVALGRYGLEPTPAEAYHPYPGYPRHIFSIHSNFGDERWCANTTRSTMGLAILNRHIHNTLRLENTSARWHWLGSLNDGRYNYVDAYPSTHCVNLSASEVGTIRVRFHAWGPNAAQYTDLAQRCGSQTSCAEPSPTQWFNSETGHSERDYFWVHLHYGQIAGSSDGRRITINHEVGHTIGLSNPGGSNCPGHSGCSVQSIMHASPPGSVVWPTLSDRQYGGQWEAYP